MLYVLHIEMLPRLETLPFMWYMHGFLEYINEKKKSHL